MKTRIFKFKILNNILYLNARLYKMGTVSSSKCSLCSESKETTTHLFYECRVSANLWSAIQNHVQNNLCLPNLSDKNVHLGFISKNSSLRLENHILLAFKRFLFENRKENFIVGLNGFWKYLMHIQKIEFQIASKNGKLRDHFQKWKKNRRCWVTMNLSFKLKAPIPY